MEFTRSIFVAASTALALGAAQADDESQVSEAPGFNELDRNDDGALSRKEAGGNSVLLVRFDEVDDNGDGKLSRSEYVEMMAKQDFRPLREKAEDSLGPDDAASAGAGSTEPAR